jgi:hypothetical protein
LWETQAGEPKQNIDKVSALYFDLPQAGFRFVDDPGEKPTSLQWVNLV